MMVPRFIRIPILRLKIKWNRRERLRGKYHNRVCMGAVFCLRWMIYDGCCWKHQDVYDRRAAKRLKRSRNHITRRSRRRQSNFYRRLSGRH